MKLTLFILLTLMGCGAPEQTAKSLHPKGTQLTELDSLRIVSDSCAKSTDSLLQMEKLK
jgi:hypothetical protein